MTDYASIGSYTHAIALPPERAPELEPDLAEANATLLDYHRGRRQTLATG